MSDWSDFPVASLYKYQPRKSPATAWVAGRYESATGRKVPKGTKWLVLYRAGSVSAHKTLKAAKKAAQDTTGASANPPRKRRRARANAPRASGAVVLVKSSARARPVRVKLPAKAKPQKVGRVIVHRAVSYKGKTLRLLKGWTVSTSSGRGVGRYKSKQAALAAAKGAR